MSSWTMMTKNEHSPDDITKYREVYKAVFDTTHDATKAAFAARQAMRSVPGTERRAVITAEQVDERIAEHFNRYAGMSKLETSKLIQEETCKRVSEIVVAQMSTDAMGRAVERMIEEAIRERLLVMTSSKLITMVQDALEAKALKAVEQLVEGISFKPKMAEPTPGRKLHL